MKAAGVRCGVVLNFEVLEFIMIPSQNDALLGLYNNHHKSTLNFFIIVFAFLAIHSHFQMYDD